MQHDSTDSFLCTLPCRGQAVAAQLSSMLRDMPKRTAAAVGTSAAGTASMLREARWKAALQVRDNHRLMFLLGARPVGVMSTHVLPPLELQREL